VCRWAVVSRSCIRNEIVISSLDKLECVDKFCGLRDFIGAGGGAEEAPRARICCAWAKFNGLATMLTSREACLKVKGYGYGSGEYGKMGKNATINDQVDVSSAEFCTNCSTL